MEVWAAFVLGLVGSLHCAGMCGPIAVALPIGRGQTTRFQAVSGQLMYNFGRVITYSILGLAMGAVGWTIHLAGFQQWLCIATGVLMLVFLFGSYTQVVKTKFLAVVYRGVGAVKKWWPSLQKRRGGFSLLAIGILNGFLPCGLVYVALATAATLGNIWKSTVFMALFGLGTIPLMASLVHSGFWLRGQTRTRMAKAIPVATGVLAVLLIIRGLGLGIPYLSPEISESMEHRDKGCPCSSRLEDLSEKRVVLVIRSEIKHRNQSSSRRTWEYLTGSLLSTSRSYI